MADGGIDVGGLVELTKLAEALPADVTAALKGVALATAHRIQARAKSNLGAQLKTSAHALIDRIEVIEDDAHHQYRVESLAPKGQPANLPLWVERGTRFMGARPYMRPAGDAEDARYKQDSLAAVASVVDRLGAR